MIVDYLRALITPLLIEPQALVITQSEDDMGVLLSVNVSKKDMGRIIGKSGEAIKSIRVLTRIAGTPNRVSVKVLEPATYA